MAKHLTRQELIEIARNRASGRNRHLESCQQCREAVAMLRAFEVSGNLPLEDAPAAWIKKAVAIAESPGIMSRLETILARLTFDSWSVPEPIGVREQSSLGDRRLRFQTDDVVLDFRAELQRSGWSFVAQVTAKEPSPPEIVLEVGRKRMHADEAGFFQWTSRRPPTAMAVRCGDTLIALPELSWKNPRSN